MAQSFVYGLAGTENAGDIRIKRNERIAGRVAGVGSVARLAGSGSSAGPGTGAHAKKTILLAALVKATVSAATRTIPETVAFKTVVAAIKAAIGAAVEIITAIRTSKTVAIIKTTVESAGTFVAEKTFTVATRFFPRFTHKNYLLLKINSVDWRQKRDLIRLFELSV